MFKPKPKKHLGSLTRTDEFVSRPGELCFNFIFTISAIRSLSPKSHHSRSRLRGCTNVLVTRDVALELELELFRKLFLGVDPAHDTVVATISACLHQRRLTQNGSALFMSKPSNKAHRTLPANMELSQIRNYREIGQKYPDFGC